MVKRTYTLKPGQSDLSAADCQVVGVFPHEPSALFETFKKSPAGLAFGPSSSEPVLWFPSDLSGQAPRVLWVPLGKKEKYKLGAFRKALSRALATLPALKRILHHLAIDLASFATVDLTEKELLPHAVELLEAACYRFDQFKSKNLPDSEPEGSPLKDVLKGVAIHLSDAKACALSEPDLKEAQIMACSMDYLKDLANLPPNICTPTYLAEEAEKLAIFPQMKVTVLEKEDMAKMGMGAFLGVAQGSVERPKFIVLEYTPQGKKGKDAAHPVVLVGKGVTFDSGGVSLKPSSAMVGMKYDMAGAATVLSMLKAVAELEWALPVVGIMAVSENMISGQAQRVGDIVKTLSGLTVEITNTDAEGRLLLCDALTYAERFEPQAVIDMATLTGACVVALGAHATGLLGNDEALCEEIRVAGVQSHDRVWELPLWEEFHKQMESNVADLINANLGDGGAGTITAACFLSRFAEKYKWAHLDIAGTSVTSFSKDGLATGRPIPLLFQFLKNRMGS